MRNRKIRVILSILCLFFVGVGVLIHYCYFVDDEYPAIEKTLRFSYTLRNISGDSISETELFINMPMALDKVQQVVSLHSSQINKLHQDADGKQGVKIIIENISPYASKVIDFTLVVKVNDRPKLERINYSAYSEAESYVELDSPAIQQLAVQLKASTPKQTARNIYEWLVNNIEASSYTAENKGAKYLIEKRMGDCTEFMYAFIALARANGISARGVNGFWVPKNGTVINAADYHDWAEFYDGKRWVLVDPTKQKFDSHQADYLPIAYLNGKETFGERFRVSNNKIVVNL